MMMTADQAAEYLGLSPLTLRNLRRKRSGPPYVKFARAVRYRKADLDEYVERHMVKAGGKGEAA